MVERNVADAPSLTTGVIKEKDDSEMKDGLRAIPRKHIVILLFITLFILYQGVSVLSGCGAKKMNIPDVTRVEKRVALVHLLGNGIGGATPMKGVAYYHADNRILKVLQSVPGGVLAISDITSLDGIFMIITSREYVDNAFLSSGYYVYSGLYTYQTSLGGTKKVHCFAEVPLAVLDKLWRKESKK